MHPEVKETKQEKCPKCRMKLVPSQTPLKKTAFLATAHCLTGCAIGEIVGMVIGTAFQLHNAAAIALSIILAFVFGYALSMFPILKAGVTLKKALTLAFASDTVSISVMEFMDNLIVVLIPGALDAQLNTVLFWASLAVSLIVAFMTAYPVNYYLIKKGKGMALTHSHH